MNVRHQERIVRHRIAARIFHWVNGIGVLVLLVTGFLPVLDVKFDWVTIHWVSGLVVTGAVLFHIVRSIFWKRLRDMWAGPSEVRAAIRASVRKSSGRPVDGYRPGKYSVSQIGFHFVSAVLILATIATGVIMLKGIETPFWERDVYFVSESMRGILFAIHGLSALFLVTLIMLHIYFAIRPDRYYFTRSMILGWITRREYEDNHDAAKWQESGP